METGDVLAERAVPLTPVVEPCPGWAEQKPDYAPLVAKLLVGITSALGLRRRQIGALAVTGTSGSFVPSDELGRPIGNAILYNDQRTASRIPEVVHQSGIGPTSAAGRIRWLGENYGDPRYLSTPDVVIAGLAGKILPSDTSHFLKAGIDIVNARWPNESLAQAGMQAEMAPSLVHPGTVIGTVSPETALETGLPGNVRIVAGMSDGCTGQIAAGGISAGDAVGVLGTTLVLKSVAETNLVSADGAVYSHRSPEGAFWPGGASNVGAAALAAYCGSDVSALQGWAGKALRHGPATSVHYPLPGRGERFPFACPEATAFIEGPDSQDRVESFRAVLEGVAFVERLGIERLREMGVRVRRYVVTGGASANDAWNRIRATALQTPVVRPRTHDSAYGAALLAGSSLTGETISATAARLVRYDSRFDPLEGQSEAVMDNYGRFVEQLTQRGYLDGTGHL
jgi:D-ribulokinase